MLLQYVCANSPRKLAADQVGYEPEVLQRDFHNSLLAAYTIDEVEAQLRQAELPFDVRQVSDRHLVASGRIQGIKNEGNA